MIMRYKEKQEHGILWKTGWRKRGELYTCDKEQASVKWSPLPKKTTPC